MGLRDFFSSSNSTDNATEAILTLDLSTKPREVEQASQVLRSLPTEAVREAITQMPHDTRGRQEAEGVVRRADSRAFDEARSESARRNRHW